MYRLSFALLIVLAGCAQPVPVTEETSPPPLPEASYAAAARSGASVYRILPRESFILVRVGRAGAMKRLGHDHAIASLDVQGLVEIRDDAAASRADIVFPLRDLLVDDHEYRKRLALDTEPSAADIAATYTNMLKVLEPAQYPWGEMHARVASTVSEQTVLSVSVTLHGTSFEYLLPVDLQVGEERLEVAGQAALLHSNFGLTPHSAAGGLLRVADLLEVEFRFVAGVVTEF